MANINSNIIHAVGQYLRAELVATPAEIEDHVWKKLKRTFTDEDKAIVNGKVAKWRNDVHWVRAQMTREMQTVTLNAGDEDLVVYLPHLGEVNGVPLCGRVLTVGSLVVLAKKLSKNHCVVTT